MQYENNLDLFSFGENMFLDKKSNQEFDLCKRHIYLEEFEKYLTEENIFFEKKDFLFNFKELNLCILYFDLYEFSEFTGKKNKNYILNILEDNLKNNIKTITIYSDEWIKKKQIVKHRLSYHFKKMHKLCDGRECTINEISQKTYNDFVNRYHIQGSLSAPIRIAAYKDFDLVAVMSFGKRRVALGAKKHLLSNNEYEMFRFCSKGNIPGIGSRLLKYFIKKYDPEIITTYADRRWGEGKFYEKIGFKYIGSTEPSYFYTKDFFNRKYRFSFRKNVLVEKYGANPSKTEIEIVREMGYDRVWDCGTNKYKWFKHA